MSNWEKLKTKLDDDTVKKGKKRKRQEITQAVKEDKAQKAKEDEQAAKLRKVEKETNAVPVEEKERYIGMDCEMVGVGIAGKRSALARVTLVNYDGEVIYDQHVRPSEKITDFRTWVSGVKAKHLKDALQQKEVMKIVGEMLKDKFLVGHALHNDLQALMLQHPVRMIRDTARYAPYMRPRGRNGGKLKPRSLRELAKEYLGLEIQGGKHDSGEDARAAMLLYRAKRTEWEKELKVKKLKVS